ncbi:MAG: hypothetical protein HQK79_18360 [Desulfobacterales bacterium]|nr:hypothetical protein [Desulfobacterales bacterium]MBF0395218.1 hypothetical protein [Desulfobacterales bacterium]
MGVSPLHIFRQGSSIMALLNIAVSKGKNKAEKIKTPGPVFEEIVSARNPDLIRDYIIHTGGDMNWYKGVIPYHMFPQWGFPLLAKTLYDLPYDISRILNAGVKIEVFNKIPANEDLHLKARLIDVDDNGMRVICKQNLITGTKSSPNALSSEVTTIIPLKSQKKSGEKKEKPKIPDTAREIGILNLSSNMGFEFSLLTGDFNPIHWLKPYANISGFSNVILHGFSTMARAIEVLNERVLCGNPMRMETVEVKFIKPVTLPSVVKIYITDECDIFVGKAKTGEAYIVGRYGLKKEV